jgi:penicillin-binding protein 1A
VVGVFVGYDTPTPMGQGNTGGKVAAPIFGDFMQQALADQPPAPFRIPPGLKLARVNLRTGLRAGADDPQSIMEAFKPGEEPDDAYSVIGFTDSGRSDQGGDPDEDSYYQPAPSRGPGFGGGRGGLW